MARKIMEDFPEGEIHVMGSIRDGFIFLADLVRALTRPVRCQFINLYYKTPQPGELMTIDRTVLYPPESLQGKEVLLACAILDTGVIIDHILDELRIQGVERVRLATLVDKKSMRRVDLSADYVGFECPDDIYLCGYGMDSNGLYRNLSYLAALR